MHHITAVCLGEGNFPEDRPLRFSVVSNFSKRFPTDLRHRICKSVYMKRAHGEPGRIFPKGAAGPNARDSVGPAAGRADCGSVPGTGWFRINDLSIKYFYWKLIPAIIIPIRSASP